MAVATAGRTRRFAGVFNYFVNPVAIRARIEGDPSFQDFLHAHAPFLSQDLRHRDYPFSELVNELLTDRDPSRAPIAQTSFVWENFNSFEPDQPAILSLDDALNERWDLGAIQLERIFVNGTLDHFDLDFKVVQVADRFYLQLEYNSELFSSSTLRRLAGHFHRLLEGIAQDPERPISALPILPEGERHQVLREWNATAADYDRAGFFHRVVARHAGATPDATAVVFEDRRWSYRELDRAANRLAHLLLAQGVGRDVIVGISMRRGPEQILAILGILKAGGAYLPLDPQYPDDRLSFMIEDSGLSLVLTQESLLERLGGFGVTLRAIDGGEALAGFPDDEPAVAIVESQLAYVIYTSGTTGKPKGVLLSHRGLTNLMVTEAVAFRLRPSDRVLIFSSLNFDASIFLISMGMAVGASLYLARRENLLGDGLESFLAERSITTTLLPPSVLPFLDPTAVPELHNLIVGGEACSGDVTRAWAAGRDFHNAYGPTESTVWATTAPIDGSGTPPIGRPVANTQVYLLDRTLRPVPVGVPGELAIGGLGLARGYLARPGLTAGHFVPDPFAGQAGQRLYKTGDLACTLADGNVDFLGRVDHQVKIRGFRIELGEIESVLRKFGGVQDALVVVREDRPGDKQLVAYLAAPGGGVDPAALREYLREGLPEYMVPATFVALEAMPLTADGSKIDRKKLPAPQQQSSDAGAGRRRPKSRVQKAVADVWCDVLHLDSVGLHEKFFDLGGHSLLLPQVRQGLNEALDSDVTITDLFQYPTIHALASFLEPEGEQAGFVERRERERRARGAIAIVGMAGRFPGADSVDELWDNLCRGVESITFFSRRELAEAGVQADELDDPDYVRAKGILKGDPGLFDPSFFGVSPREATIMDPQHRLFLEVAWEALESSGCDPATYPDRIGVFAGSGMNAYAVTSIFPDRRLMSDLNGVQLMVATGADFLATRVSFKLGLRGPGVTLQTACSTSLVAVHSACESLRSGECDMALAGGVSLGIPVQTGHLYTEGGTVSRDGHCRAFDKEATGMVPSSGAGIVVLKPLDDALADGDRVWAVIRGTAINNDGSDKIGFTAPSVNGQAQAIFDAQRAAGVTPEQVSLVEAHGTATPLGDPIEVAALTKVFRQATPKQRFCALTSVKSNFGHLDAAAGVTGLIKTALSLWHGKIPPSLHFDEPNPELRLDESPFYVNDTLSDWADATGPRVAGVSSFGIGGTNAHAVLEEAPAQENGAAPAHRRLLVLSARTDSALETMTGNLLEHLQEHPELDLDDAAHTLQVGRQVFPKRRVVVCGERDDALTALADARRRVDVAAAPAEAGVVFMFSGQGAQYPNMARGLYEHEEVFREAVDTCCDLLRGHLGEDLRELLFPGDDEAEVAAAGERLGQTSITQPALFVVEVAAARLWMSWGFRPAAMIGHSIGEVAAACLAGVFSLEKALELVSLRGRLMESCPPGDMLAVPLPEDDVQPLLDAFNEARPAAERLGIAALNAPGRCVVSGTAPSVAAFAEQVSGDEVDCRILRTSHAFHSAMMDPVLDAFQAAVARLEPQAPDPALPLISNLTGTWMSPEQAADPAYWASHIRRAVRFADGLRTLAGEENLVFLELGPGRTLKTFARRQIDRKAGHSAVSSIRHPKDDLDDDAFLLEALGRVWGGGAAVDWTAVHGGERRLRVPLPTYPFERRRFWLDPPAFDAAVESAPALFADPVEVAQPSAEGPAASATERLVASLWQDGLGLDDISPNDNFYELGGDSLLATTLTRKLRKAFQVELAPKIFQEKPTIAELAGHLGELRGEPAAAEPAAPLPEVESVPGAAEEPAAGPAAGDAEGPELEVSDGPRDETPPAERDEHGLSFAQQRLWVLGRVHPGELAGNVHVALRIGGRLDEDRLEHSLGRVVERHDALRSTFPVADGTPTRIVAPRVRVVLERQDLTGMSRYERDEQLPARLRQAAGEPFDSGSGPLVRAVSYRLADDDYVLLLALHELAADEAAIGPLLRQLWARYEDTPEALAEPLPTDDFVAWQRRWCQGDEHPQQVEYWRRRWANVPRELAFDFPPPSPPSFAGGREELPIPPALARQLPAWAERQSSDLFTLLLAVFAVLLRRFSGQDQLLIGASLPFRPEDVADAVGRFSNVGLFSNNVGLFSNNVGLFSNTVAIRADLAGNPSFREVLSRIRESVEGARGHGDVPFEVLLDELEVRRGPDRPPLFQAMLAFHSGRLPDPRTLELDFEPVDVGRTPWPLTLHVEESRRGLTGRFEYGSAFFHRRTVSGLGSCFLRLLRGFHADPDTAALDLPLLSEMERMRQLLRGNDGGAPQQRPAARRELLHTLFEAQVYRTPDAAALIAPEETLTYRQLNRRANRLAWRLRGAGEAARGVVAIYMERSLARAVTILAVLKAGGTVLTLRTWSAASRLAYSLNDAGVSLIVTCEDLAGNLPEHPAPILTADAAWESTDRDAREDPEPDGSPEDIAFITYRVGSGDAPLGVPASHRNMCRRLAAVQDTLQLDGGDRILQKVFDLDDTAWEGFLALSVGACIVVNGPQEHAGSFVEKMAAHDVSVLFCLGSDLAELAAHGDSESNPSLRQVVCEGVLLPRRPREQFFESFPGARLLNLYGPVEAGGAAAHPCDPRGRCGDMPIGNPLAGFRAYLLDDRLEAVPEGFAGQLYLGGDGLSAGYLSRPAATGDRFLADPFSDRPGARIYRTGDLGRRLPDGRIELVRSSDHRVRQAGHLVALAEIEEALGELPEIAQVLVMEYREAGARKIVAYYTSADGEAPKSSSLAASLARRLPPFMNPDHLLHLEGFPRRDDGTIDRDALPSLRSFTSGWGSAPRSMTEVEYLVSRAWKEALALEKVDIDDDFFDLGGSSLLLARVYAGLPGFLRRELSLFDLFAHPTIRALAGRLATAAEVYDLRRVRAEREAREMATAEVLTDLPEDSTAIVGMACRLPGAEDVAAFWRNLLSGTDSITFFDRRELLEAGVDPALVDDPDYVPARAVLDDVAGFDEGFFGFTPREAQITDPQQRAFLECCWQAMEDAGYVPGEHNPVGVYGGIGANHYLYDHLIPTPELWEALGEMQVLIANDKDNLCSRVAFKLGLTGPAMLVQSACSTSMVAMDVACSALAAGACSLALAGGVSFGDLQQRGYLYEEGMTQPPDGVCRPFDAGAHGSVPGQGVAVVALRRLADALADGDHVYAVVRGRAVNNDGARKRDYTGYAAEGQHQVIRQAQEAAGVSPETITYVESSSTASPLGDPIEVESLTRAWRRATDRKGFCALGAVKPNIGIVDTAAGAAAAIKAALSLHHGILPATLHHEEPNPAIDFAQSPFYVPTTAQTWDGGDHPRRAGVSAFGFGGTNAHLVLEQAITLPPSSLARPWQLLVLSARTPAALEAASRNLSRFLEQSAGANFADVAYTLQVGRKAFKQRRVLVCNGPEDAVAELGKAVSQRVLSAACEPKPRTLAFMFPGHGAQYMNMGQQLYRTDPSYRDTVDRCWAIVAAKLPELDRGLTAADRAAQSERIYQSDLAHLSLFIVEYALARHLMRWGIVPEAMIGYGLGELVAATLAGVFSLEDVLTVAGRTGELIQTLPAGEMILVNLPERDVRPYLSAGVSLAGVNTPDQCLVSGTGIRRLAHELRSAKVSYRHLFTSRAFHSAMLDPVLPRLSEVLSKVTLRVPEIPFLSSTTGTWITEAQAVDPRYWVSQAREPVRFADGLEELCEDPERILVEVGPERLLGKIARQIPGRKATNLVLPTMRHPLEDIEGLQLLLTSVGRLWLEGLPIDWQAFSADWSRCRLPLPAYPFEKRRHWIDAPKVKWGAESTLELASDEPWSEPEEADGAEAYRPNLSTSFVAPRDAREQEIADLWGELLGIEAVGLYDNFFELGGSSLLAVNLLGKLSRRYEVTLPTYTLMQKQTVAALAELIEKSSARADPAADTALVEIRKGRPPVPPLFMVHPIGGEIYFYRDLAQHLGPQQPVYAFQAQSLVGTSEPFGDIREQAAAYALDLQALRPEGPYLLGGASYGGLVAFEMAALLRAAGADVRLVVLVDAPAPGHMPAKTEGYAEVLDYLLGDHLELDMERLREEAPEDQLDYVFEKAKSVDRLDVLPPTLGLPMLTTWMAHQDAMHAYQPAPYPGRALVFRPTEIMKLHNLNMHLPWIDLVQGGIEIHRVPGNHITMNYAPNVKVLARHLRRTISSALSHSPERA